MGAEGERYAYYKIKHPSFVKNFGNLVGVWWWLRTPAYYSTYGSTDFCMINSSGSCTVKEADSSQFIVFGFSI